MDPRILAFCDLDRVVKLVDPSVFDCVSMIYDYIWTNYTPSENVATAPKTTRKQNARVFLAPKQDIKSMGRRYK